MRNRLFTILAVCFMAFISQELMAKDFTLVIDAGHGGHDAGAVGAFSKEKNINLSVALGFGKYVERNCPDVKVIYTRNSDVFVTLHGRADIANKAKADLFVSIHTNAQPAGYNTARGLETYTLGMHRASDNLDVAKRENSVILVEKDYKERYEGFDPNSSESYIIFEFMQDHNMQKSVDMAKLVQKNVSSIAGRPDKGVKQAGFLVLRETSMPSCLIELGFISTPAEEQLLNNETTVDNISKGIYNAFVEYKKKYDANNVQYRTETQQTVTTPAASELAAPVIVDAPKDTPKDTQKEISKDESKKKSKPQKTVMTPSPEPVQTQTKATTPATVSAPVAAPVAKNSGVDESKPVFKVQIAATDKPFKAGDPHFKGRTDYDQYKENGMTKYTIGCTNDLNEILRIKKELAETFTDCFVVAFKNGEKIKTADAISEYKNNK